MHYIFALFLLFAGQSFALAAWQPDLGLDDFYTNSTTTPHGKSSVGFSTAQRSVTERWSANGNKSNLGTVFSQKAESGGTQFQRDYEIRLRQTQYLVSLAHGLTSRWGVAFRLPIVHEQIETSTTTTKTNVNGAKVLLTKQEAAASAVLGDELYGTVSQTHIGHVEILSKYKLNKMGEWQLATIQSVRFPSGERATADTLLSSTAPANSYGLGAGIVASRSLDAKARAAFRATYRHNFSDEVRAGLSTSGNQKMVTYQREPGGELFTGITGEYIFAPQLALVGGYFYASREADEYKNQSPSVATEASSKQVAEVGFALVPSRHARRFETEMVGQVVYARTTAGANVESADLVSAQIKFVY